MKYALPVALIGIPIAAGFIPMPPAFWDRFGYVAMLAIALPIGFGLSMLMSRSTIS